MSQRHPLPTVSGNESTSDQPPQVWFDVLFFAFGELGLSSEEFWDLSWYGDDGWDYKVWCYRIQLARKQEPMRDLQAQLHNMLADKNARLRPHEIMWLITDRFAGISSPTQEIAKQKANRARMKAAGLLK